MTTFILVFLIFMVIIVAMAVGVMAGRKPIAGSCGGLGAIGLECDGGCENPCPKRQARLEAARKAAEEAKAETARLHS